MEIFQWDATIKNMCIVNTYIVNFVNHLIAKKLFFALLSYVSQLFTKFATDKKDHIPICKVGLKANLTFTI